MSYIEKGSTPTQLTFDAYEDIDILQNINTSNSKIFKGLDYWKYEDREKMMDILLNPFLKKIFNNHLLPYVFKLEEYNDGDYLELIFEHDNFYVAFYDDYEQEYSIYKYYDLKPKLIFNKLEKNDSFKEIISLNPSNHTLQNEIDKFAYNIVLELKDRMNKHSHITEFHYNNYTIEKLFYENVLCNYIDYPQLAFVSTYYALTNINELLDYINKVIGNMILSQGFIILENKVYQYNDKINNLVKDKINKILNNNITINNIKSKVLDSLRSDIVPSHISSTYFDNKPTFIDKEIDTKHTYGYLSKFKVFEFIDNDVPRNHINFEQFSVKIDEQQFNLSGKNLMNFSLDIVPKCYSPKKSYVAQIKYYFKQEGRVNFIKDFPNENVSIQEIMSLPIDIEYIKIYDMKEFKEEE